jgi:hypothetical protein
MQGVESDPGLNVRIVSHIFDLAEVRSKASPSGFRYTVRVAMMEIYNEGVEVRCIARAGRACVPFACVPVLLLADSSCAAEIRDLLRDPLLPQVKLEVRGVGPATAASSSVAAAASSAHHTSSRGGGGGGESSGIASGPSVTNLTSVAVKSAEDLMRVFARGLAMRATASTHIHEHSSRSHCVLRVEVEGSPGATPAPIGTSAEDLADGLARGPGAASPLPFATRGRLYLVDLAGSERISKSAVTGARLKEAQHINKSLSALGDVLEALDKKAPHVPFRNSKLTLLLQVCG